MKNEIHPDYHPVVFHDMTTGKRFITRSTVKSEKTEEIDGVDHFVVSMGITSDSHPFFTGKAQFVDTEGRIDKFQKRFGSIRRAKKPSLGAKAPEAAPEAPAEEAPAKEAAAPEEA